jgi:hypothetical protein
MTDAMLSIHKIKRHATKIILTSLQIAENLLRGYKSSL